jgi:hypothetical protein
MRVLVACEWSGRVRDAFRRLGHDAWSCDLLPGKGEYSQCHMRGDIFTALETCDDWDMLIAFPPCTYIATIGDYYGTQKQANAIRFVQDLWDADIPKIAIENPIGSLSTKWRRPTQYIQPYWFGDPYSKKTCLWLRNLPDLYADRPYRRGDITPWVDGGSGSRTGVRNSKRRAITFPGIARAMAEQWGGNDT